MIASVDCRSYIRDCIFSNNAVSQEYSYRLSCLRRIFSHIWDVPHSTVLQRECLGHPLLASEVATLNTSMRRIDDGEPLQYVLGYEFFYSHKYFVGPGVFIPRPETELLVDYVINQGNPTESVFDVCTGSGCVAISLALAGFTDTRACDSSLAALNCARSNASFHGVDIKFFQHNVFDLLSSTTLDSKNLDWVVCNPPYVPTGAPIDIPVQFEPKNAVFSGYDGLDFCRKFVPLIAAQQTIGQNLLLEHYYDHTSALSQILYDHGYTKVTTLTDMAGYDRVFVVKKQKS